MSEQQNPLSTLLLWWACIEASRETDGEPPIADDTPVLHFCSHGATAIVTAGDFRSIARSQQ